jgi:hypothetical protein
MQRFDEGGRRTSAKSGMGGHLPRTPCSCFERGHVGFSRWRNSKKRHGNRLRRRVEDKAVLAEALAEAVSNTVPLGVVQLEESLPGAVTTIPLDDLLEPDPSEP